VVALYFEGLLDFYSILFEKVQPVVIEDEGFLQLVGWEDIVEGEFFMFVKGVTCILETSPADVFELESFGIEYSDKIFGIFDDEFVSVSGFLEESEAFTDADIDDS